MPMVRPPAMVRPMSHRAVTTAMRPLPVVRPMTLRQPAVTMGTSHVPIVVRRLAVRPRGHLQRGIMGAIAMRPIRIRHRAIPSHPVMATTLIGLRLTPGASPTTMEWRGPPPRATIATGIVPQRVRPPDRPKPPLHGIRHRRVPAVTNTLIPVDRAVTAMITTGVMMMSGFSPAYRP